MLIEPITSIIWGVCANKKKEISKSICLLFIRPCLGNLFINQSSTSGIDNFSL